MRTLVVFAVVLLFAPTLATATQTDPPERLTVSVLRIEGKGVYVAWTPAVGAISYAVYRGPDLEHLEHIATTPNLEFSDFNPPKSDTWYQIVSQVTETVGDDLGGPVKGRCLALRGATGFSVTLANCIPSRVGMP